MKGAIGDKKFIAPDGGWGWVVVFAFASSNIIVIPLLQGFGLLYRDVFIELDLSATDISTIINVNSAFGLMLGLFIGPLLKVFGYRKVAMAGSLLNFFGFILCSTSTTFMDFIIYYGIINSMGFCTTISAFGLALNTYFNRKRNIASGLCTAFTGLGPVIMPFVMSFLMKIYGVRGTAVILSALILNSFAGALLLHPVQWHTKKEEEETKLQELELLNPAETCAKVVINPTIKEDEDLEKDEDTEENEAIVEGMDHHLVHGSENPLLIPTKTTHNGVAALRASKLSLNDKSVAACSTWWRKESNVSPRRISLPQNIGQEKKKSKPKKWISKMIKLFDFDLLKDAGYRNIWLGMSLAFTGEINFSLMTPLILGDKGMSIDQTAQLMSSIAISDIIFRFISPFVGDFLKWTPKYMYMASLVLLVVTRTSLIFVNGYPQIMASCLIIGVAKGLRTVYMALVIPSYVPLEKLASASGLQTLLNGILLMAVGPSLGYLRDRVGNYNICIYVINFFSVITIALWTFEYLLSLRNSKHNTEIQEAQEG